MKTIQRAGMIVALSTAVSLVAQAQFLNGRDGDLATGTTVTNVTGTIAQLNYGHGVVEGFLIGANTLLEFGRGPCAGVASLGAAGNSVTYSGSAYTATSGFTTVHITSFTNNTTKATYTAPTQGTSTAYGPTSGAVKQLNYGHDGSIDGFLFTPSGSSTAVFVETGERSSATLKPLLTVGATVSVTGTTMPAQATTCTTTGALTTVDATSLTVGGQTIVISGGGNGGGGGHRGN